MELDYQLAYIDLLLQCIPTRACGNASNYSINSRTFEHFTYGSHDKCTSAKIQIHATITSPFFRFNSDYARTKPLRTSPLVEIESHAS